MTWKGVIVGFIAGLLSVPVGAWLYLKLGYAPVATSAAPMPFETYFAKTALHARVFKEARQDDPVALTEQNYMAGATLYREDCAVCHGLPGQEKTAIANGMFPKPPELFKGKGVTDDPVGETYWKIRNGIRLTGMPGFQNSLSDEQMWQIAGLLAHADKLPAGAQDELNGAARKPIGKQ
jgi:thiosulfate dehydrogenase